MDMDRGTLARIDRKLLAGLDKDEAYRTLRVPADGAKWSTWKRYCDSVWISMGRAVTMLIDRELISVFGDITGDEPPVLAQQASEQLAIREAKVVTRKDRGKAAEKHLHVKDEQLRRREHELNVREQRVELMSKVVSRPSVARVKVGRNER